jgi:hypothetical protein
LELNDTVLGLSVRKFEAVTFTLTGTVTVLPVPVVGEIKMLAVYIPAATPDGGFAYTTKASGVVPVAGPTVIHEGPLTPALNVTGTPVLVTEMNWLGGAAPPDR